METKNTAPVSENNPEEKKSNKACVAIVVLLAIYGAGITWLYLQERQRTSQVIVQKEEVIKERDDVKADLLQLQEDYSTLQTNDKGIQAELDEKRAEIAQLIMQAERHKNDAGVIAKLRKETETLRKIMKGYIVTIDSLNTLNQTLIVEKEKIKTDLNSEQEKSNKLAQEKEDLNKVVSRGSKLKATGVKATGIHLRSGGSKESETTKAKRSDKLRVSFTIGENSIAKKGQKDVYIRLLTPDGKELAASMDDANRFSFNGVKGFFCSKETINYNNEEMSLSMFILSKAGFIPGKYIVEVYCEEVLIGQTTLILD